MFLRFNGLDLLNAATANSNWLVLLNNSKLWFNKYTSWGGDNHVREFATFEKNILKIRALF